MLTINRIREAYDKYNELEVVRGVITYENAEKVNEWLGLKELSNMELSGAWELVWDYFTDLSRKSQIEKEWEKADDTRSAWLEVINMEARDRREIA